MTNPLKGEVRFKVGEEEYVLAYPINSIIAAEDHFQRPFDEVRNDFMSGKLGLKGERTFSRFGLIARRPAMTDEETGELIGCYGQREFAEKLAECFVATFGLRLEAGQEGDDPPAAGAGTGATATGPGDDTSSAASPSS